MYLKDRFTCTIDILLQNYLSSRNKRNEAFEAAFFKVAGESVFKTHPSYLLLKKVLHSRGLINAKTCFTNHHKIADAQVPLANKTRKEFYSPKSVTFLPFFYFFDVFWTLDHLQYIFGLFYHLNWFISEHFTAFFLPIFGVS